MTVEEFSNGFDTLVNSYRRFKDFDKQEMLDSIEFDEYEKSFYLTKAQEELVMGYYDGKNIYGDSFEATEELRRQLDALVKTKVYTLQDSIEGIGVSDNSVFFKLPDDLQVITMEQVIYDDGSLGCSNGSRANVLPIRQDEYNVVKENPFRGATKYKALRLDSGDGVVELVSKYIIGSYLVRYLSKPTPIVLEDLPNGLTVDGVNTTTECALNPVLHKTILERAVLMALRAKGIYTDK